MKKNNSYLEDFEGMIVRNDYLSRSTFDRDSYNEFKHLSKITASEMFFKLGSFYRRISYHEDDVRQLCDCYLVSYLSLYSLKNNKEAYNKFADKFFSKNGFLPSEEVLKKEDRNRIIKFLRQQCSNSILTINRKSRNVIAGKDSITYFAHTKDSYPVTDVMTLIESYEKYKYRKVSLKEFTMLQKKCGKKNDIVDEEGFKVIVIQILASSEGAFEETLYIPDNRYSPENILNKIDEEMEIASFDKEFRKIKDKSLKLKNFINSHKRDARYKEEIAIAKKMIKEL